MYANAVKHGLQIILTARLLDGFSLRIAENLKTQLICKISFLQILQHVKICNAPKNIFLNAPPLIISLTTLLSLSTLQQKLPTNLASAATMSCSFRYFKGNYLTAITIK